MSFPVHYMPFNVLRNRRRAGGGVPEPGEPEGPSHQFLWGVADEVTANPTTLIAQPLGDEDGSRLIAFTTTFRHSFNRSVSKLELQPKDGEGNNIGAPLSAARIVRGVDGSSEANAEIWAVEVTNGVQADVTIEWSASPLTYGLQCYRLVGLASNTPTGSDGADGNDGVEVNVTDGGIMLGSVYHRLTSSTSLTGLDTDFVERADFTGPHTTACGSRQFDIAQTVTVNNSPNASTDRRAVASWR